MSDPAEIEYEVVAWPALMFTAQLLFTNWSNIII